MAELLRSVSLDERATAAVATPPMTKVNATAVTIGRFISFSNKVECFNFSSFFEPLPIREPMH